MRTGRSGDEIDLSGLFSLQQRTALVTGASSGLGHRFARLLDAAGARVAVVARRRDRLHDLADVLTDPVVLDADLTEPGTPARVVARAAERLGGIDVLVNNAGAGDPGPAEDEDTGRFRSVVELNLVAPFEASAAAAREAQSRGGMLSVVNVSSMLGLVGGRSMPQAGYAASKGGLIQLTRELASQWAGRRIRVNAIAPGWFATEMTSASMFDSPRGQAYMARNTPMTRGGEPHELDGVLLFLASTASSFVTGQTVVVDGGWTIV